MLFNSFGFIFLFLPVTFFIYFFLNKQKLTIASKAWLVFASLFFYGWWNIAYLPLILGSIIFNYLTGILILKSNKAVNRKLTLILGITCNLMLLGYYKYTNFFLSNIEALAGNTFHALEIILPLGISFFTFTQIAYLIDTYKGKVKETNYLNYALFVTFFPHLIAGPIIHHSEMMPQFDSIKKKILNHKHISLGIFLFVIGLFKKVIIADNLAIWVNNGYNSVESLNMIEAWVVTLSYSFQLYFDFSGYTDMALGIARMFNINLPINFNSPYKATNIQDFWRRWHITLSRFLRDYIYIPLGGNKKGEFKTCSNLLATFLIGGLWHGAGWTYIIWGILHGLALIVHRLFQNLGIKLHNVISWLITFNFINITWVFFRAENLNKATVMLRTMFGFSGLTLPDFLESKLPALSNFNIKFGHIFSDIQGNNLTILFIMILFVVILCKNFTQPLKLLKPNYIFAILTAIIACIGVINLNKVSEFLYFQF